ncbi:hypothetical protein ACIXQB_17000 [Bacteroides fragilis]|nr:hypothetical protein [Bacteroides fragilis]
MQASFRYAQSEAHVLRIHSFARCGRGNPFLKVTHLHSQRTDQPSQFLIRACFNNRQFHTKIIFKFLNIRKVKHIFRPFQTAEIKVTGWRALALLPKLYTILLIV